MNNYVSYLTILLGCYERNGMRLHPGESSCITDNGTMGERMLYTLASDDIRDYKVDRRENMFKPLAATTEYSRLRELPLTARICTSRFRASALTRTSPGCMTASPGRPATLCPCDRVLDLVMLFSTHSRCPSRAGFLRILKSAGGCETLFRTDSHISAWSAMPRCTSSICIQRFLL